MTRDALAKLIGLCVCAWVVLASPLGLEIAVALGVLSGALATGLATFILPKF